MPRTPGRSTTPRFSRWMTERLDRRFVPDLQRYLGYIALDIIDGDEGWTWVRMSSYQTAWVALKIDGERLLYQCGCKRFKEIAPEPCEHVVAAIHYLERRPDLGVAGADADFEDDDGDDLAASVIRILAPGLGSLEPRFRGGSGAPPRKRLKSAPIGAATEDVEAYLVQDAGGKPVKVKPRPRPPVWKPYLEGLRQAVNQVSTDPRATWPVGRELLYAIDVPQTLSGRGIVIETLQREPKKAGGWKVPATYGVGPDSLEIVPETDRDAVTLLLAAAPTHTGYSYQYQQERAARRTLPPRQSTRTIPVICRTGRCMLRTGSRQDGGELIPVAWDEGGAWDLTLDVRRDEARCCYVITGSLRRGDGQAMPLDRPVMLTAGGFVFWKDAADPGADPSTVRAAPLDDHDAFGWVQLLRDRGQIRAPFQEGNELLAELYRFPKLPRAELPEELRVEEVTVAPTPRLTVRQPPKQAWQSYGEQRLIADVAFDYDGTIVESEDTGAGIFAAEARRVIRRDPLAESAAIQRLQAMSARYETTYDTGPLRRLRVAPKQLPTIVRTLLAENWRVEAEGKLYRQPGELQFTVSSGIDWFDLNVTADFGGVSAPLPRLLAALRRGESMVPLDDGTFGVLPEAWLKKYAPLAGVAKQEGDSLRFTRAQAGLLDALLATQPAVEVDAAFRRVRDELAQFKGVRPVDPPKSFVGSLRPYQRDSLGWFDFLRRFGFGGCLADDMGLGKTVQVLSLLEQRRTDGIKRPSLVVVPRSLIFNWQQEAARFAPRLRVLDQSHASRVKGTEHLSDYDLVLSTYGTLRRDALYLKDVAFDYVVLDEAQAVKNADSESAKAVRLLRADHRLVLSGTPVQNHLGDLWSLFEFLNPGLLGSASLFAGSLANGKAPEPETREILARGLRPFILRRTKEQVAPDLPPRQEQTIYCELEGEQRKLYDELRAHYRSSLLGLIDAQGVDKSKIQILEALLRLRQAACHPALISRDHAKVPSAKLEALIPQLQEVLEGGHKALIFSQFTQFLTLVKAQLKPLGVTYEYLDGKTRDRQARVERFQSDPECKLFLISLKAGGVGLNLTAADYCFLLDPWWNPAVEAQAIDRTHRIGQTKHVFACRLISRDTVEEKVLALQQSKRALADAIVGADNALIRTIGREDLELLLS